MASNFLENPEHFCVQLNIIIRDGISLLDQNAAGIIIVVDEQARLIGTVTDGDIRRAVLNGITLEHSVGDLLARNNPQNPVTALVGTPEPQLLQLMNEMQLRHIPIVDIDGKVVDIILLSNLIVEYELPLSAVLMAGGFGKRMGDLTKHTPKPMLPVGEKPLMERTIKRLRAAGIRQVNITTHFQPEKIVEHFGAGDQFDVDLNYINEDQPLGTAGALRNLTLKDEPFLVINGDILTGVDFRALHRFHSECQADLTVAVRQYNVDIPYGVVKTENGFVSAIHEKPSQSYFVNAGIYLVESHVCELIPESVKFDMTDLIEKLIKKNYKVASFPVHEYWIDIGQHDDYRQAESDILSGKIQ